MENLMIQIMFVTIKKIIAEPLIKNYKKNIHLFNDGRLRRKGNTSERKGSDHLQQSCPLFGFVGPRAGVRTVASALSACAPT
jgi:hypothetical protein